MASCTGREIWRPNGSTRIRRLPRQQIKAQHRQGTGAGGTGQDELIGQIASPAKVLQGIDHRVDVIDDHSRKARSAMGVCWGSSPISSRTTTLVSSVLTIVRIARGSGDGLLHLLKAQAAVDLGAVEEQLLRLVLRGHQHQPPLKVDAGLKPGTGRQSEGIPYGPGQGELALGGEGDGGHDLIVRRCGHQLMNGLRIRPTLTLLER